jgi:hypothetical protein
MLVASAWAGSLPNWILIVIALGVAYRVTRGGGGQALQELSIANTVLTKGAEAREHSIAELKTQVALLEQKTDVSTVLQPFVKWATEHEVADQERHETTVAAFGAVADRLTHFDERADARAKQLADVTAKTSKAQLIVLGKIAAKLDKAA